MFNSRIFLDTHDNTPEIQELPEHDSGNRGNRLDPISNLQNYDISTTWIQNPAISQEIRSLRETNPQQDFGSGASRISTREYALRDIFIFSQQRGWSPPPINNEVAFQRYMERHPMPTGDYQNLMNSVYQARNNDCLSDNELSHHTRREDLAGIQRDGDVEMTYLDSVTPSSSEDIKRFQYFQHHARDKFRTAIKIIENRKDFLLRSFETDNRKLYQLQNNLNSIESQDRSEDRYISRLNKVQRIRLRAVEMETIYLQRLKNNFQQTMSQFRAEVHQYLEAKSRGEQAKNPIDAFVPMLSNWDPHKNIGIKIALNENHMNENEWNSLGQQIESHMNVQSSGVFPLNKLPHEILTIVLGILSQKSEIVSLLTVCKTWAEIIVKLIYYRPHINKKAQLNSFMGNMRKKAHETVFNYRLLIKRLNFSFVGDYMTDEQLSCFVGCKNLERLTLVFCKLVTTQSVSKVLKGCMYLQSVDITGIKYIDDDLFHVLSNDCKRIQGLYVPHADQISGEAIDKFIENAPMLKRVKITFNKHITNPLLLKMTQYCPLLVEVDLTSTPQVDNTSLARLLTNLPHLREFRLTHNVQITDLFATRLLQNVNSLPALRLVDFSACENLTDKTVAKLVALAPKLRNIFLGKCSRITDNSLISLSKLGKNLQTIHFGHCFNISDDGVKVLIQNCPRIQYVDFACCTNLTNQTLYELADLTKLKRIGLVKCSQMTDEGLLNMTTLRGRNDSLERVHLSYCTNLTIYPIYELLMACPKLSHLSLTAVPSFLRADITQFCRTPPSEFTVNQRQIFCVFSGKGVQKLRHHLMSLTKPTDGPTSNVRKALIEYIGSKKLFHSDESEEDGLRRIANELNQDTAAILTASSMFNAMNEPFQNMNFERLDSIFSFSLNVSHDQSISSNEMQELLLLIDESFCQDPSRITFRDVDGIVAPKASNEVNGELAEFVRKYHKLSDRISDFEVNISSLSRIQFQYCGSMLGEMSHIYMLMIDLNRSICDLQDRIYTNGYPHDIKGLTVWRLMWGPQFTQIVEKFKLSTIVLRLYLKDNIAVLTRQRELAIQRARTIWDTEQPATNSENGRVWTQTIQEINERSDELFVLQRPIVPPGFQIQMPMFRARMNETPIEENGEDEILEES